MLPSDPPNTAATAATDAKGDNFRVTMSASPGLGRANPTFAATQWAAVWLLRGMDRGHRLPL
jgi:hypothetical protein